MLMPFYASTTDKGMAVSEGVQGGKQVMCTRRVREILLIP